MKSFKFLDLERSSSCVPVVMFKKTILWPILSKSYAKIYAFLFYDSMAYRMLKFRAKLNYMDSDMVFLAYSSAAVHGAFEFHY